MTEEFKCDEEWRKRVEADKFGLHEFELMYFGASNFGRPDGKMRSCDEHDQFPPFWEWLAANVSNMARASQTWEQTKAWRQRMLDESVLLNPDGSK